MKRTLSIISILLLSAISFAQTERKLSKVLELQMPDGGGERGASVAWNPETKRYYACMAGNESFPMAIFNNKGERLSDESLTVGFDVRGFWWSPFLETFCANGYDDNGWVAFTMDQEGNPTGVVQIQEGYNQPEKQSVGAFNSETNELYFLDGQNVLTYSVRNGMETDDEPIRLHVGSANEEEALDNSDENYPEDLNVEYNPALIYTGKKNAEFGIMNYWINTIELHSKETGYVTEILYLPKTTPTDELLCFAYANGIYWIFNKEERTWEGFR